MFALGPRGRVMGCAKGMEATHHPARKQGEKACFERDSLQESPTFPGSGIKIVFITSSRNVYGLFCPGHFLPKLLSSVCFLVAATPSLQAQSGISLEGPLTVFRTGGSEPLLTLNLPFSPLPTNSLSLLRFDFGFATAEPDVPDTFFDSFSVTLQRNDQSATALLLTADRTGVQWAPSHPGGLSIDPSDVQHADTTFPNLNPALALKFSYSVTFALPLALAGGPLTLFFDLFDNLNQFASLAYVSGVHIETGVAQPRLHSAAVANGAYTEAAGAVLNETYRTLTLNKPAGNRFFRVFADKATRVVSVRTVGQQVIVGFQFAIVPQLTLETSGVAGGPFATETNAVWDSTNRTFTLPKPVGDRFYEVRGNTLTEIVGIRASGTNLVVEYRLIQARLFSAANVNGLFVEESSADLDETNRTFTLPGPGGNQFYRVLSDVPMQIVAIRLIGSQVVIEYHLTRPRTTLQSAATPNGFYADETKAVLDETKRTITVSKSAGNRFYRIRSDVKTRIGRLRAQGNELVLDYEGVP